MGFGVATKGAADISEMFSFFRKVSEACITSTNSCSFKRETLRTPELAEEPATAAMAGVGVLGGRRSPEPGELENLEDAKGKKQLLGRVVCGPRSGTESRQALDSHSKTGAGILSTWLCFQPTMLNAFFSGSRWQPQPAILCSSVALQVLSEVADT